MRDFFRRLWRYRIVVTIVGIFVGAVRAAIWIFVNYSTVVALFAMIGSAIGYYYSPLVTGGLVAGLLTFTAIKVLSWHAAAQGHGEKPVSIGHQPAVSPKPAVPVDPVVPAVDYAAWDGVDPIRLWQAACLWFGIDPQTRNDDEPPPGAPTLLLTRLKQEVLARRIQTVTRVEGYIFQSGDPDWVKNHVLVDRDNLRKCAVRFGEKPKFLFSDQR